MSSSKKRLVHKERTIVYALALQTGRSVAACTSWIKRQRLGHRYKSKAGKIYTAWPTLTATDWGYNKAEVYYSSAALDKLNRLASAMRKPKKINTPPSAL